MYKASNITSDDNENTTTFDYELESKLKAHIRYWIGTSNIIYDIKILIYEMNAKLYQLKLQNTQKMNLNLIKLMIIITQMNHIGNTKITD